jgi:hypothetical protein
MARDHVPPRAMEWNEFRALSPAQLAGAMRGRIVIDLRNVCDAIAMRQGGFSITPWAGQPGQKRR